VGFFVGIVFRFCINVKTTVSDFDEFIFTCHRSLKLLQFLVGIVLTVGCIGDVQVMTPGF